MTAFEGLADLFRLMPRERQIDLDRANALRRPEETPRQRVTVPDRPKPLSLAPSVIPDEYVALATWLGFAPGKLLDQQIRNFLIEQQIPIYNYNAVCSYMTQIAVAAGANFFWRPLRKRDADIYGNWGWARGKDHGYYQRGDSVCSPYDKLVPSHILGDVKVIQEKFGDQVAFFISDYKADSPDPFILVTAPSETVSLRVFGAWDEPGFGVI